MPDAIVGGHPVYTDKLLEAETEIVYGFSYTVRIGFTTP
jgi:hypothetical protein